MHKKPFYFQRKVKEKDCVDDIKHGCFCIHVWHDSNLHTRQNIFLVVCITFSKDLYNSLKTSFYKEIKVDFFSFNRYYFINIMCTALGNLI